ncbi:MAG: pyridoxal 5'-phosphate synthase lyase subunit PdxS, partial [Exiguobacterium sp.]
PGTGNIVEAVRHMRTVQAQVKRLLSMSVDEVMTEARDLGAPFEVLMQIREAGRLPVVNFAAGGIATPADAALMMHLGADGVFVGSGIFKAENPEKFARAIVEATTYHDDYERIAHLSKGLGEAMKGLDVRTLKEEELMAPRGW